MTTVQAPAPLSARQAKRPFNFNSAAHLLRILPQHATNLGELLDNIRTVPDESIFQHTFQTLQEHHFIREGFTNDFSHWAFAACNEVGLAERLAAVDVREYTSIQALRERLEKVIGDYLESKPGAGSRTAFEPFYFCASDTVVIPTPFVANNLREFADALDKVSIYSVHFHFIEARLRLKLTSNDFSMWLENEMDLPLLASRLNHIDIYTLTLHDIRRTILRIVEGALA